MLKNWKCVLSVGVMSVLCSGISSTMADSGKPSLLRETVDDRLDPIRSNQENQPVDMAPIAVPLPAAWDLGAVGLLAVAGICWKKPRWLLGSELNQKELRTH